MDKNRTFYDKLAKVALHEYGLQNSSQVFIRHSNNLTFKVESVDSKIFLLRIHIPLSKIMEGYGSDYKAVSSEMLWLDALCHDTNLVLQSPVRNLKEELVAQVAMENHFSPCHCTLLRWVDGEAYHRDLESEETAYQIGIILATLHNHANHWEIPESFSRPKRDITYFEGVLKAIHPAVADGRIKESDYREYETAISKLSEWMNSLEKDKQNYGIMHGDAQKGNLLYHEGQIRIIDFSFCALGYFMFDLGVCLSDMKPELHSSFLAGYQCLRSLPNNYQNLVEGFFLGSIVGTFSFWMSNPRAQGLLTSKTHQIAQDYARKFNQGEHFWFS